MTRDNLRWLEQLPVGWHLLYRDLTTALAEIGPDIVVSQAKQKLGSLRVDLKKSEPRAELLIRTTEKRSRTVCELCGEAGELRIGPTGWHRTLCDTHGVRFRPASLGHNVQVPLSEMPQDVRLDGVDLPWPLFTLDFEASGLGELTYPIELGIARWTQPDAPIESWSVLIKPIPAWLKHRVWMPESETIHGITRDELQHGVCPRWALEHANALLGDHTAFCDGGEHDLRWLRHLAHAAHVPPSFELAEWKMIAGSLRPDQRSRMMRWQAEEPIRHRAGADAMRHLRALAVGLSLEHGHS